MRSGLSPGMPESGGFADMFSEFDRRLSSLERSNRLPSASIGSGGLTFKDGGKASFLDSSGNVLFTIDESGLITFEADGSQLSVLDGSKLKFNRSDGTRILEITPGGGFKVYAANGTTERVVVDGDGLTVGGVLQPGIFDQQVEGYATDDTAPAETTEGDILSTTLAIPVGWNSWKAFAICTAQCTGETIDAHIRIDGDNGFKMVGVQDPIPFTVFHRVIGKTATGSRSVSLRARSTTGFQGGIDSISLFVVATRTS